jgi:nucleotide-binding universal stress UspA family protein
MKIIVTTDFSDNSIAGLRMAATLARLLHAELHFLHVCYFPGEPGEKPESHNERVKKEMELLQQRLQSFVKPFLKYFDPKDIIRYHVVESFIVERAILNLQKKTEADLICISTRGAGKLRKLLGTTAGNLITRSSAPVMVVPFNYKMRPLKTVVYFCDLENPAREIKILSEYTDKLHLKTELIHFSSKAGMQKAEEKLRKFAKLSDLKTFVFPIGGSTVSKRMLEYTEKNNPSLVALFARERQGFLQRIFNLSHSEEMAFHTKIPLLVFHKK